MNLKGQRMNAIKYKGENNISFIYSINTNTSVLNIANDVGCPYDLNTLYFLFLKKIIKVGNLHKLNITRTILTKLNNISTIILKFSFSDKEIICFWILSYLEISDIFNCS